MPFFKGRYEQADSAGLRWRLSDAQDASTKRYRDSLPGPDAMPPTPWPQLAFPMPNDTFRLSIADSLVTVTETRSGASLSDGDLQSSKFCRCWNLNSIKEGNVKNFHIFMFAFEGQLDFRRWICINFINAGKRFPGFLIIL